ncbi:SNF2 family N-terminal domain-containing protein [Mycotypha africana]|uniref:SNF2 family N-terminal domain-containing protein n=1 Tax=Mycotypha africana TaxID=64632 RepID=UPI002300EFE4|nr:SNF2 family N-terminal domain-containing protein [Mycotypha africana]KAI8968258.1 SNF2 family N-terminal domain-containing protein [Mycotypha africana]
MDLDELTTPTTASSSINTPSSFQGNNTNGFDGISTASAALKPTNQQIGMYNNPNHISNYMQPPYNQQIQFQQQQQQQQHQLHLQREQQKQRQYQQYQHQQHQGNTAATTPKRGTKRWNRTSKKKVIYDDEDADEDEGSVIENEEDGDDADYQANKKYKSKKRHKKSSTGKAATAIAEAPVVMVPMPTKIFEKLLDYRLNPVTNKPELLVKYKHSSYHHVEWIPKGDFEKQHLGKYRVQKFISKWNANNQRGEDFSEYLKIDRVIDEGELYDPVTDKTIIYYLIKWNGLFYDASTWEHEDDVQKMNATKITEFQRNRAIPQEKLPNAPKRPDLSQFIKYEAGMKYKHDNQLRPYQLEGLNWLRFCYYQYRSCILADEMGLGKTVQSVAFLNDLYYKVNMRGPFLVVAPLSTIPHWQRAFQAWTDLNVIDYRGSVFARQLLVETEFYYKDMHSQRIPHRYKFDVLITTYEMALAGVQQLKDIPWRCGVFDEAHRLKNKQSKVGEVLKTFIIDHKLLLTGTPLQNNLDELYSLLNFMQPEDFSNEKAFFAEYGNLQTAAEVEKLQALLKPIMLRRFKEDVEKTIPVKEETVIEVELTAPQKKWYRAILEKNFSFLKKGAKSNKDLPHLRNIMMQLRKCCIHPYLLEGAEEVIVNENHAKTIQEQFKCLIDSSGKLVLIDKLLRKLFEGNHKVLIFSQFTSCLDILSDYLRGRQYPHERIDGSVPGEQRQAAIDRFSTLPIQESFVFLLCTRAGGVGINLTAADTCIIFDSDWNPQNDLQAQARCHRIGQTKAVQVYRLICRNTYEKDMFDRAGMKLGLDKAVMQRMNSTPSSTNDGQNQQHQQQHQQQQQQELITNNTKNNELSRKEIEDLLKRGAYGAVMDDEDSAQFCEEDIDQILERRTTVIRHEGNEKGSIFSKATFATTSSDQQDVDLDDPDFWEKWADKANIDKSTQDGGINGGLGSENDLIVYEPRKRRQVQRFGARMAAMGYDSNNDDDSDAAYEDESERSRKRDAPRLWSLSEKTKYERKLMIYGYGAWKQMQAHFSRRSVKDMRAVTRCLIRKVRHVIEPKTEEDRRLLRDLDGILSNDAEDGITDEDEMPYTDATKKQIAEFRSFLIQAPQEYVEHIERKGRNFLLRIQMLHMVRDRIVPKDWEEAKKLAIPKVTGSLPCDWWGEAEDRDLLLGICKHGYQQYLTMRKDKEFCFYGKKYDDSKAGTLQEDDDEHGEQQHDTFDTGNHHHHNYHHHSKDDTVYVWPSKADIGMRLRRIIAAFLREQAIEKKKQEENLKRANAVQTQSTRSRIRGGDPGNRWNKRSRADFLRTVLSFGVETVAGETNIRWDRFREISGLANKSDAALDLHYQQFVTACKEIMKKQQEKEQHQQQPQPQDGMVADNDDRSRESSEEPNGGGEEARLIDTIPYDKARRALRRIKQMRKIREEVVVHPEIDTSLQRAKRTSGLPSWWEVPVHDKALLQGICKHGIGRHDLMITDADLPFYKIVQDNAEQGEIPDIDPQSISATLLRINWPKELVIQRRIDSLCDLILNPKQPASINARSRKRKSPGSNLSLNNDGPSGTKTPQESSPSATTGVTSGKYPPRPMMGGKTITPAMAASLAARRTLLSDVETDSDEEDDDAEVDEDEIKERQQKRMRYEAHLREQQQQQQRDHSSDNTVHYSSNRRMPTKPLKSQHGHNRYPFSHQLPARSRTPPSSSSLPTAASAYMTNEEDEDDEMEEGEITNSDDEDYKDDNNRNSGSGYHGSSMYNNRSSYGF